MGTAAPEVTRAGDEQARHVPWHERYWDALVVADRYAALSAVKALRAGGRTSVELLEGLVAPAQRRIGELGVSGEWGVAQEHAATAVNEGVAHWLRSFVAPPS